MAISQVNFLVVASVLALIILVLVMLTQNSERKKLTPLAGIAFAFIIAGVIFGEKNLLGYGLFGTGIILSIIDIILKNRKDGEEN